MTEKEKRRPLPDIVRGGLWLMGAALSFTLMTAFIRAAAAGPAGVHPFEIAFFRAAVNLLLMMPYAVATGARAFRTNNHRVFAFRGLCGVAFLTTYFTGAAMVPVAQSQALIFTSPLWGALMAILFLGEGAHFRRFAALAAGFAGALIILRPGVVEISLGALLVLAGALANAISNTLVKFSTRSDHPDTVVLYLMLYVTPMMFIPALFVWTWPSWEQLGLMIGVGIFATLNQRFLSRAFAAADATAILPFDFARLPFAALIGILFFAEAPDIWVWAGGAVIFVSTVFLTHREARAERRNRP